MPVKNDLEGCNCLQFGWCRCVGRMRAARFRLSGHFCRVHIFESWSRVGSEGLRRLDGLPPAISAGSFEHTFAWFLKMSYHPGIVLGIFL